MRLYFVKLQGDEMLKKKQIYVRPIIFGLLISMLFSNIGIVASADNQTLKNESSAANYDITDGDYANYIENYKSANFSSQVIELNIDSVTDTENKNSVSVEDDRNAILINSDNNYVEYSFEVKESGLYNICLNYKPVKDTAMDIRLGFMIDGVSPYSELDDISFTRIWVNAQEKIQKDESGNEIRPEQTEKYAFRQGWAEDDIGLYRKPYSVYLETGVHTMNVTRVTESVLISSIILKDYSAEIPDYDEYNSKNQASDGTENYTIEAESAIEKSHSSLAATIDTGDAGMSPVNPAHRVVNSFGQSSWTENGQWASWQVPETLKEGKYVLRFRAKQNGNVGTVSYRKLLINGKVPFKEAESMGFKYYDGWQIATFGEENPYLIHLKPGDILTLTATTGPMAEPLKNIYNSVNSLNDIYQSIIMVTGTDPDTERDYNIQKEIPTLLEDFKNAKNSLTDISSSISDIMGSNNPKVFFIHKFIHLLDSFLENYRLIVPKLSTFKSYIESFAGETYDFNSLPLELDKILIMSPDSKEPNGEAGFFKSFTFEIKRFIYSFTTDYNAKEKSEADSIDVWCSLGRDQAQSVKQLIENNFTPKTGIKVNFKISNIALAEAILSGCEPDVSLSVAQDVPIDLAIRGQALDLTDYIATLSDDYMAQFLESAWTPFQYKGGTYAMPITQTFQMLYYRTDVFKKLGLEVPNTWEEFYKIVRELQRNNFQVGIQESNAANPGISASIALYETLLLQNGSDYYNSDLTKVNFESTGGKQAFLDWVKLYKEYDVEKDFDLNSRFRSGEMPLAMADYNFCLTLQTVAPEISGRWAMAPMPATVDGEGNLNRTVVTGLTGTIILNGAKKRGKADQAFEFVKWWADSDAQVSYSNIMESLQGVSGRPAVANMIAFSRLGWSQSDQNIIIAQRDHLKSVQQIPGTYIIYRHLTNALRTSYSEDVDPLRQLNIQCRDINTELARKRAEFEKNN